MIFFTAAHIVPYFGFVSKTVLTWKCFSYCWALLAPGKGLPCFSLSILSKKAEGGQEAGTGYPKGYSIPQNVTFTNKKCREGSDSKAVAQEVAEICLAGGRW